MLQWNTFEEIIKNDLWFSKIRWVDFNSSNLSGDFYFTDGENNGRVDMKLKVVYWNGETINLQYQDFEQSKELRFISYSVIDNGFEFWSERVSDVIRMDNMIYECYEREMVKPTDDSQEWSYTNNIRTVECNDDGDCENYTIEWIPSGEICNGVNKHQRLQMVYMGEALEQYKLGDVIELDSSECGTYEYKEEWNENPVCGSELIEAGFEVDPTSKYKIKEGWIKPIQSNDWEKIDCGYILDYELLKSGSFDCGYRARKTITELILENVCGNNASEYIQGLSQYNLYDIYRITNYVTSPTVTDDMLESEWEWDIESQSYSYDLIDTNCCECGYRVSDYDIKDGVYEYVCAYDRIYNSYGDGYNSGYTYYKKYEYTMCKDGSNKEWTSQFIYFKPEHITSGVTSYIYDPETDANTTKRITTYRMYWDENDNKWYVVTCAGDNGVVEIKDYPKNAEAGYKERWFDDGYVCCGSLELENPLIMTITDTEGDWNRDGLSFTSNTITHNESTYMKIYFNVSRKCTLKLSYDISSESNYDKFYYSDIDYLSPSKGGYSGSQTGVTTLLNVTEGDHFIVLRYTKDNIGSSGRDNVIVTFSVEDNGVCTKFAKYTKQQFQYSVDSGNSWVSTGEYRYGSLIETNSEECGYVPTLEQWVLICPDITYETAEADDGCVECQQYNNAPTMFAIEKKQRSYDRGVTWEDVYENGYLVTRTERLLKWKAPKCGYTGDIFEERWSDEYCDNGHKYGTKTMYVSSDNGNTWVEVEGTTRIEIKEENSNECEGAE